MIVMSPTFIFLVIFHIITPSASVSLSQFIPFGADVGDEVEDKNDDGNAPAMNLTRTFGFFGAQHSQAYVNTNGAISFISAVDTYTPHCDPVNANYAMVSPFWADVDTRSYVNGSIYYRQTTDPTDLAKVQAEVQRAFPNASATLLDWALVVTWYRVTFCGSSMRDRSPEYGPVPENTMQAVLATNDAHSFVIFFYNQITWTTGVLSGGDANYGLGGSPARAGFDAGDGEHVYLIDGSCTESIVNLTSQSNVNEPGVFVFQIDQRSIIIPSDPHFGETFANEVVDFNFGSDTRDFGFRSETSEKVTVCAGHGRCVCDKGYEGYNCTIPVDFCAQPIDIVGYANYSHACAPHGHCVSVTPTGAKCICGDGWFGPFCENHDFSQLVTERCYLFYPKAGGLEISEKCPDTEDGEQQACIPDNLNCFLKECSDPIGWCIPRIKLK